MAMYINPDTGKLSLTKPKTGNWVDLDTYNPGTKTSTPSKTTPTRTTSSKQATLYGPNGTKEVVTSGSARASTLQSQGWGLTSGSYQAPAKRTTTQTKNLGDGGVNHLFQLYYGRDATADELKHWSSKSDADLRPVLKKNEAAGRRDNGQTTTRPTTQKSSKQPFSLEAALNDPRVKADPILQELLKQDAYKRYDKDAPRYYEKNKNYQLEYKIQEMIDNKSIYDWTAKRMGIDPNAKNEAGNIDPLAIAKKLGYTENDFANDPNFSTHWKDKSEAELTEALKGRGDWDEDLGRKRTPNEQETYNEDKDWLDTIPEEYRDIVENAMNNIDVNRPPTEEELVKLASEAETAAREDLDPYYKDLEGRDMEDLRDSYSDIRNEALRFQQAEAKNYKETLAETKQSLRARGMTFSGRSREVLGQEAAKEADTNERRNIEGELPQDRRYNWEDARAGWQESSRDIGKNAERRYGSDKLYEKRDYLNPEGLPDPYDGKTFKKGRVAPLYNPKKNATQDGYVSKDQADIAREKELEVQKRKEQRLSTNKYF